MCIIAVKKKGLKLMDEATIRTMFSRNRDGAGVMWAEESKVHIRKGFMNVNDILQFLGKRDWTDVPMILHFRIGTAGGNTPINCHPYPIRQPNALECDCDLGMVHNGIMSKYNPRQKEDMKLNDTQVFIRDVINQLPKNFINNKAIMQLIENDIGGGNKLAFLDKTEKITLVNKKAFIEDDGYYYSNSSYKPLTTTYKSGTTWSYTPWSKPSSANKKYISLFELDEKENDEDIYIRDSLSFDHKFHASNDFCDYMEIHSEKELEDIYDELEEKCTLIEDNFFETLDGSRYYEITDDGLVIRSEVKW